MKVSSVTAFILVGMAALVSMAGCFDKGPIEQAVLCSEVTATGAPKVQSDNFSPDVASIYCSVKLAYTSAKINVKAEWYVVNSAEAALSNHMIGSQTLAALTQYIVFSFTRSNTLLPRGDYQVKIYFDDKFVQSLPFKVQGEGSASTTVLSGATVCTGINLLTEEPINPTALFPSDITKIFCSVKVDKADFGTTIKARWTYVDGELGSLKGKVIAEPSSQVQGRQYVSFSIATPPDKLFPKGEYKVSLLVGEREATNLTFNVVDAADIKWPYISEASTFKFADQDQKSIILTPMFKADTKEIYYRFKAYNAPADTEVTVQWNISKSTDLTLLDELLKEDKTKIEGTTEVRGTLIRSSDKFVTGDYVIKILINGEEVASLPFKVQ